MLPDNDITYNKGFVIFLGFLTLFAIFYFNLTPFGSVDCWWHMKMAEYFLKNGAPVIYDIFSIQTDEKILATYPNVFPGILFIKSFEFKSFLGLNLLRIGIFVLFISTLIFLVRKSLYNYIILFQIIILAFSMKGRVILQPDLFNFLFFTLWIFFLEKISENRKNIKFFIGIVILELIWVNTHPLFFYHGLFIALVYLSWLLIVEWRNPSSSVSARSYKSLTLFYFFCIGFIWLLNPLGWKAFESLFVNMLHSEYNPMSLRPSFKSLFHVNTYGYVLIFVLFLFQKPWSGPIPTEKKIRYALFLFVLLVPALIYERCLPFPIIFLILIQGMGKSLKLSLMKTRKNNIFLILVIISALLLIIERNYLFSVKITQKINEIFGLSLTQNYSPSGVGIKDLHPIEPIREISILERLAVPGNCATNHMPIASCGVWFCPDKPFYWYGHAAIINARTKEIKRFLINLPDGDSEYVKQFLHKYKIKTVILTNYTSRYFKYYRNFQKNLYLIYIDPFISLFVCKGKISESQIEKARNFYSTFKPGHLDKKRFDTFNQKYQYLLLWFSAEMTGNDGSGYLSVAKRILPPLAIRRFLNYTIPIIQTREKIE